MMMQDRKRQVLLCDDNAHARQVMARVLSALGLHVIDVESGMAALRAAQSHDFDLALIDIEMPDMDGIETAKHLAGLVPRLVAVTGRDAQSVDSPFFSAVLTKPLDLERLTVLLNQMML